MNDSLQPTEEPFDLDSVLIDWEDGNLGEREIAAFRQRLADDAEMRRQFLQAQMLTAALRIEADSPRDAFVESSAGEAARPITPPPSKRSNRFVQALLAMAACGLVMGFGRWMYLESQVRESAAGGQAVTAQAEPKVEATSTGIAIVTRVVGNADGTIDDAWQVGTALSPGRLALTKGIVQIEFFCGASVVVEGPAELELLTAKEAIVHRGRLRASVPPAARGFTLRTADMTVVDLGTEFGIAVDGSNTDVQVFDGEVELISSSGDKRLLNTGQAIHKRDGQVRDDDRQNGSYVGVQDLRLLVASRDEARFRRWSSYSQELRKRPDLIAYYGFEQSMEQSRILRSDVVPADSELDGAIVGAEDVVGRWQEKRALNFKRPGDRVRVVIPGEYRSLTFATWVRIDSLDRWYNSLFLTDSYEFGEPHWQILDTGEIHFSVRASVDAKTGPPHFVALSKPFWDPAFSGQWLHLAVVYDVDNGTTTHYLNGQVLSTHSIPEHQLVKTTRIGAASLGNWSTPTKPDEHFAIRNLNGSIDELAIFAAAVPAEEIAEMYRRGKP